MIKTLTLALMITIAVTACRSQAPAATAPSPVRPSSFTVNGYTYDCAIVRQQVAAGENYTPDGHYIYAVLLMDCDI